MDYNAHYNNIFNIMTFYFIEFFSGTCYLLYEIFTVGNFPYKILTNAGTEESRKTAYDTEYIILKCKIQRSCVHTWCILGTHNNKLNLYSFRRYLYCSFLFIHQWSDSCDNNLLSLIILLSIGHDKV